MHTQPLMDEGRAIPATQVGVVTQAVAAMMRGAVLIWGVGFAPAAVLHNAAHDARHANAFPCH